MLWNSYRLIGVPIAAVGLVGMFLIGYGWRFSLGASLVAWEITRWRVFYQF